MNHVTSEETVLTPDGGTLNDLFQLARIFGASVIGLQYPLSGIDQRTEAYFRVNGQVWIDGSLNDTYIMTAVKEALEAVGCSLDDYRSFTNSSVDVALGDGDFGLLTVNKMREWPIVHIELSRSISVPAPVNNLHK